MNKVTIARYKQALGLTKSKLANAEHSVSDIRATLDRRIATMGVCKVMIWITRGAGHTPTYLSTVGVNSHDVATWVPACWNRALAHDKAPTGEPTVIDIDSEDDSNAFTRLMNSPAAHYSKAGGLYVTVCIRV